MSDEAIYDDFCTKLSTFAGGFSPPLQVAFPGIGFTPPAAGMWLELQWVPNETVNYGMADDAPVLMQGLAQVGVCYRPGGGLMAGLQLAGAVVAAFPKGTRIADLVRVYRKGWVASVIEDPERLMHPVIIPWQGFDA